MEKKQNASTSTDVVTSYGPTLPIAGLAINLVLTGAHAILAAAAAPARPRAFDAGAAESATLGLRPAPGGDPV